MLKRKINIRKVVQMLDFFAMKQGGKAMNKMKAYKLLWLADRYHLRQYGRMISDDTYYAMPFGIVPSITKDMLDDVYHLDDKEKAWMEQYIQAVDSLSYRSVSEPDMKVFSISDCRVLQLIWDKFGTLSQFELSDLSHKFPEWLRFQSVIEDKAQKNSYKVNIDDFFKNVEETNGLFEDDVELLALTSDIYHSKML